MKLLKANLVFMFSRACCMKKWKNLFLVMVGLCLISGMTNLALADVTVTAQHELEVETVGPDGNYGVSLKFTIENTGSVSLSAVTLEIVDASIQPVPSGSTIEINLGDLPSGVKVPVYWNFSSQLSVSGTIPTIHINGNGTDINRNSIEFTVTSTEVAK